MKKGHLKGGRKMWVDVKECGGMSSSNCPLRVMVLAAGSIRYFKALPQVKPCPGGPEGLRPGQGVQRLFNS